MKKRSIDLFRFATLRAPQLLSKERRELGFVEHPDPSKSVFLGILLSEDTPDEARAKVVAISPSFTPVQSVESLKNLSETFWKFSLWLSVNKNVLERSELDTKIPSNLSSTEILCLWDNVYYDLIAEKNPYIRQACLQMIVTANFIENYASFSPGVTTDEKEQQEEAKLLKRLANGKVIINHAFTKARIKTGLADISYQAYNSRQQTARHKSMVADYKLRLLEGLEKEFVALNKQYKKDYALAYQNEDIPYQASVKSAVDDFLSDNPDLRNNPDIEQLIPIDLVSPLKFAFHPPLDENYRRDKLSATAEKYLLDHSLDDETIETVLSHLAHNISKSKKDTNQRIQRKVNTVSIHGIDVKKDTSNRDFAISFELDRGDGEVFHEATFFSFDAGYSNAFFREFDYSVSINGTPFVGGEPVVPEIISSKDGIIFAKLGDGASPDGQLIGIEINFTLDNGKEYSIAKEGISGKEGLSGLALIIRPNAEDVTLYGINRIGVADYRKVEQELCCYIPGEVSHIENIMAKEYKERATRNLTSTENTTEFSSEREIEDTNDTTSTTRHELSSEIANVIENDRTSNYGFNASAGGTIKNFNFSTGGYGDFSTGQSISNSNSNARSYAEDVTRRALERIVQKTATKRTSKILKEFEETNKHGFDNREGTQHVTGVYRWIDKVFKNRVVNYGKRLIYEFMIPEPARFYKDAIILEVEESDVPIASTNTNDTHVLVKPTHPSEHGILNSDSILRDNYKEFTSLYNVNPIAPLDDTLLVHGNYTESIGNGNSAYSFNNYTDISIDINYECVEIKGTVNMEYSSKTDPRGYIRFSTGGRNWEIDDLRSSGNKTEYFTHSNLSIPGAIKVSANTRKVISFTLSLQGKCRLKKNIFSQWQQDVYSEIMSAYEQQLQAYNDAHISTNPTVGADPSGKSNVFSIDPRFNADIVNRELKRLCIEMLTKPFGIKQGQDFYQVGECEVPELKLSANLDLYASRVKFFEQAFEWDILSSQFYPYYWAKKCDWKSLFQSQAGDDHIFRAFLQSGMGRLTVPVREGFEDAVTFYAETGRIWNGNSMVIDTDDELYLSIVDEMTILDQTIEKLEWETVVPSTLTVIQAKSTLLDEEGLPCCETNPTSTLEADTTILTREGDTTASA